MALAAGLIAAIIVVVLFILVSWAALFFWLRRSVHDAWAKAGASNSMEAAAAAAAGDEQQPRQQQNKSDQQKKPSSSSAVVDDSLASLRQSASPVSDNAAAAPLPGSPASPAEVADLQGTWDPRPYRRKLAYCFACAAMCWILSASLNLAGVHIDPAKNSYLCNPDNPDPTPHPDFIATCEAGVGVSFPTLRTFAWVQFGISLLFHSFYVVRAFLRIDDSNAMRGPGFSAIRNGVRFLKTLSLLLLSASFSGGISFDHNDSCEAFTFRCRMLDYSALHGLLGTSLLFAVFENFFISLVALATHWDLGFAKEMKNGDVRGSTPLGTFRPVSWKTKERMEDEEEQRLMSNTSGEYSPQNSGTHEMGCWERMTTCTRVNLRRFRQCLLRIRLNFMNLTRTGWLSWLIITTVFVLNFFDLSITLNASYEVIVPLKRQRTLTKPQPRTQLFPLIEAEWNVRSCSRLFDAAEKRWGNITLHDNGTWDGGDGVIIPAYEVQSDVFEFLWLCSNKSSSREIIATLPGSEVGVKAPLAEQFRACGINDLTRDCQGVAATPSTTDDEGNTIPCKDAYKTAPTPYGVLWTYDLRAPVELSSCQNSLTPSGLPPCPNLWLYVFADLASVPSMKNFSLTVAWVNVLLLTAINALVLFAVVVIFIADKCGCPIDMQRFFGSDIIVGGAGGENGNNNRSGSNKQQGSPSTSPLVAASLDISDLAQPVLKRWLLAGVREYPVLIQVLGESIIGRSLISYYEFETEFTIAALLDADHWRASAELEYEARATLVAIAIRVGAALNVLLPSFFCPKVASVVYAILKFSQILFLMLSYVLLERKTRLMHMKTDEGKPVMESTPIFLLRDSKTSSTADYVRMPDESN